MIFLRMMLAFVLVSTFAFSMKIENILVLKATKSTIEAEDLINGLQQDGIPAYIEKLHDYQLIVTKLPHNDQKALSFIATMRQEYPKAFRLFLEKQETQADKIDVKSLVHSLKRDEAIPIEFLSAIPKKDLPLWGALVVLVGVVLIVWLKSFWDRVLISKLQYKLYLREKEIEKSISQEKNNIAKRKKLQEERE